MAVQAELCELAIRRVSELGGRPVGRFGETVSIWNVDIQGYSPDGLPKERFRPSRPERSRGLAMSEIEAQISGLA